MQNWICTLALLTATLSPTLASGSEKSLKRDLKKHRYDLVAKALNKSSLKLRKLKQIAKHARSSPLLRAVDATYKISKVTKKLKLPTKKILQAAFFCETCPMTQGVRKSRYFSKQKSTLAYSIEFDAKTHNYFILLDGKKSAIGKGKKKVVKKAILYDHKRPKLLARGEEQQDDKNELQITKALQGGRGLFQTHALCRTRRNQKNYNSYYSKIYSPGSLQSILVVNYPLSTYEKIQIAAQSLQGLQTIHAKGIVHLDLGARNYFVNIPKGAPGRRTIEACVADFGRAQFLKKLKNVTKVQGNTTYVAPEGLYPERLQPTDFYQTDIFAMGCVFYRLFYGVKCPWQDVSYVKETTRPIEIRYTELANRIRQHTESRREQLASKQQESLSVEEKFELLMLTMLHIDPSKRGTTNELCEQMQQIYQQAKEAL